MLVTFKTRASYPNITMFGDVALKLLDLMGRGDTVPSAIAPEDIPHALQSLRAGVATEEMAEVEPDVADSDEDQERPVSIHSRAVPLIELLEAARRENKPVLWEQGRDLP